MNPPAIQPNSPVTQKPALSKRGPVKGNPASPSGGLSLAQQVRRANRWRENYNPLRSLVMSRVVDLLEQGERGEYADLQWLFRFVEKRDPVLRALVKRRRAALQKLDWEIKVVAELPEGYTEAQAKAQKETLRSAYDFIDNLREAIGFLALAEFRGYAHVQKHYADGAVRHLECLPQWNWVRDGLNGDWFFNQEANNVSAEYLAQQETAVIDRQDFIIREEDMPIDEIAVVAFVRKNLSQKDWDAFVEIFGIPGCVVIGPPNVPVEKESDYQSAAESVAEGASGYLPNGADAKFADSPRGQNPFKEHLDQQNSDLVLAGTGGKLTMLNEATGLGSGNAEEHGDAFDDLAIEEASVISELFQKQFDAHVLAQEHPGQPPLAYFEICAKDEEDVVQLADTVVKFHQAGLEADAEEMSERTGMKLTQREEPQVSPSAPGSPTLRPSPDQPLRNRDTAMEPLLQKALQQLGEAQAVTLQPVRERIERIQALRDPQLMRAAWLKLRADLPNILEQINADPPTARVLADALAPAVINGMAAAAVEQARTS